MERLAAISIDLDEIRCYMQIHGLSPELAAESAAHAIYDKAIPRFEKWLSAHGIAATFFVIGQDLERPANRTTVQRLAQAGHEIGNHSYHHAYDLSRKSLSQIHEDIEACSVAIEEASHVRPQGFRAPGYVITDAMFNVLDAQGFRYDSSVFPCPAYYGAKSLVMGSMQLTGRTSHSVIDDARVLTAPADPYRVGVPYWKKGAHVLELPIGVTRDWTGRLPFIGTSVAMLQPKRAALLARWMVGRPLVNLELHGVDLADAEEDGLGFLKRYQPDLKHACAKKQTALDAAIHTLQEHGYTFVTLAQAAQRFSAVH